MAIRTRDEHPELEENHEINVTPFIDVMLVLLIIFMVAAPLATVDVSVDLPASTAQAQPEQEKPLYLTVDANLALSLDQQPVSRDALQARLHEVTAGDRERRIFLRGDHRIAYGDLMAVMNLLRDAGYLKVALVAQEQAGP